MLSQNFIHEQLTLFICTQYTPLAIHTPLTLDRALIRGSLSCILPAVSISTTSNFLSRAETNVHTKCYSFVSFPIQVYICNTKLTSPASYDTLTWANCLFGELPVTLSSKLWFSPPFNSHGHTGPHQCHLWE